MKLVVLGLSITSSWGNGHATTFRALLKEMARRGHEIVFLERDASWYAGNRDMPQPPFCATRLYDSLDELRTTCGRLVAEADAVILGSYVPDGIEVAHWLFETAHGVKAFYDIDTPVTLASLERGDCAYLTKDIVPGFDLYLSFTGGPTLRFIEEALGASRALPLYCAVDAEAYRPQGVSPHLALGYLGTYSADRQPKLDRLLLEPAGKLPQHRFAVAGPMYPPDIAWPSNVERSIHVEPRDHPAFYASQRFTLNVTRADMVAAGWSPSVRLFEAAACGVPILSDWWQGLDRFFEPGKEILIVQSAEEVTEILQHMPESRRKPMADKARARVLRQHTAAVRAHELEGDLMEAMGQRSTARSAAAE